MDRLKARLEALKKNFAAKAPPEALDLVARTTQELVNSGQAERALGVGDRVPEFTLPSTSGENRNSRELLARGPLIISFFRGRW